MVARDVGAAGWRPLYLLGIVLGGAAIYVVFPDHYDVSQLERSTELVVASGLLMGFGGRMCNGCTSGHGICGIARLSRRSITATAAFFGFALATMFLFRHVLELY